MLVWAMKPGYQHLLHGVQSTYCVVAAEGIIEVLAKAVQQLNRHAFHKPGPQQQHLLPAACLAYHRITALVVELWQDVADPVSHPSDAAVREICLLSQRRVCT